MKVLLTMTALLSAPVEAETDIFDKVSKLPKEQAAKCYLISGIGENAYTLAKKSTPLEEMRQIINLQIELVKKGDTLTADDKLMLKHATPDLIDAEILRAKLKGRYTQEDFEYGHDRLVSCYNGYKGAGQ